MTMPLLLCDRDGVINHDSPDYIKSPDEFVPIHGSIDAIARLHHAGWRIAVVTNQSGLGRGLFDLAALHAMHAKLHALVGQAGGRIDAIFFCPHGPDGGCGCRKPAPGMFVEALSRFGTAPGDAVAIGDSARDLRAAADAGITDLALVRTGNGPKTLARAAEGREPLPPGTVVHADLAAFATARLG